MFIKQVYVPFPFGDALLSLLLAAEGRSRSPIYIHTYTQKDEQIYMEGYVRGYVSIYSGTVIYPHLSYYVCICALPVGKGRGAARRIAPISAPGSRKGEHGLDRNTSSTLWRCPKDGIMCTVCLRV